MQLQSMLRGRHRLLRCGDSCRNLPEKIGDVLTPEQYEEVKELGLLVDKDDQVGTADACRHDCCSTAC